MGVRSIFREELMDKINIDYEIEKSMHPENFDIMWCDNCQEKVDDSHDCNNCSYCNTDK